ncbi:MAG: carbohydrate ABC transporter permease [Gammaproteobacteria bacterium]|nr:carbohydrate ABC transporter permease [Gammaproteobacteria bacterium]
MLTPAQRVIRAVAAWSVVGLFAFPIYYWFTIAFRVEHEIFNLPPLVFDWTFSGKSFEEVFGISLGYSGSNGGLAGGGNFYMMPRLVDTIIVAVGSTALVTLIATLGSYALSRMRFSGQHHFVFWILSTRMMPPVAVAIPMFFIYKEIGLMDTHIGIILVHTLMNLPLAVLLLKSFFDDIPTEIDEAALIDGASRWTIFRKIVLPMALGGIAATAVLCFIFSWTEFLFVLTLTQTGLKTVPVVSSTFVTSTGTAWGNMAALGVGAMVPAFIFILLVQKNLVRGLTLGSLKG